MLRLGDVRDSWASGQETAAPHFADFTSEAGVVFLWFLRSKDSMDGGSVVPWILAVFDVAADSLSGTCLKYYRARYHSPTLSVISRDPRVNEKDFLCKAVCAFCGYLSRCGFCGPPIPRYRPRIPPYNSFLTSCPRNLQP